MSQNPDQLQQIGALLPELKRAREAVAAAEKRIATLELRSGQETVCVHFLGLDVLLTTITRESGWMPVKVHGRQALLDECLRAARDDLILCRSKVEGLEHKLQRLAKGQP